MFKNQFINTICGLAAVAFLASTAAVKAAEPKKASAEPKEKKIITQQIPAAVMTAFQKAYPKAVVKGASQEVADSTTMVEIQSVDGSVKRDVQYTADGKVVEVEESLPAKALPEIARQTISTEYPKGKIEKAERVTKAELVQYEVLVVVGKERTELVFDASGKTVKTETGKTEKDKD